MKKRKKFKIGLYFILSLLLILISFVGFKYYQNYGKYPSDKEKYPHYIGYINTDTALLNKVYKLCDDGIYKTHHGAPKDAFKISKKHFRTSILSEYKNNNYSDSGYLNFRFLVNCEGHPGWFEITEMNLDLEEIDLNDDMVNKLLNLTSNTKHWNIFYIDNVPKNYYMYISYRIENGKITEILP